jgi:hypothetical protein
MKLKKRSILALRVANPTPTIKENMLARIKNKNTQAIKTGYETWPRMLYMVCPHHVN